MVFLKKSLSRRYLNLKFKKFDYAQANTAWSQTFLTSQPFKKLTKNVGLCCNSSHIFFKFFSFFIQGKETPARPKLFPGKLHAVLVTSGFSENLIVDSVQCQSKFLKYHHMDSKFPGNFFDSVQCQPMWSLALRSVSQFWICKHFNF